MSSGSKAKAHGTTVSSPRLPRIDSLQPLRYGAELMIIGYHFYTHTENEDVNNFNYWGNIGLTFFFLLSGFILAYQYSKREEKIDTVTFFLKRFSGLYPLYFLALSLSFVLHQNQLPRPWALAVTLFLCLSNWIPSARLNLINTPAWTVGAFLVLYALFPYCLRLMKSFNPTFRTYFLPPLLYLGSLFTPLLETGLNTGIVHPILSFSSSICLPSFLLGMNLALNYLDQDWDRHPMILQRWGASISILLIVTLPWVLDARAMPLWAYLWKDMGLASPIFCVLIYYTARQKDYICWVLQRDPLVFVGNCSYGMYLFQAFCWDIMQAGNTFFFKYHHQRTIAFVALLTTVACFTVKWVQQVYTPVLYDYTTGVLKRYRVRSAVAHASSRLLPWIHSRAFCEACSLVCFCYYMAYVNTQVCAFPSCRFDTNKKLWVTWDLDHRKWFMADDYRRMLAFWALPCQPRHFTSALLLAVTRAAMIALSAMAVPSSLSALQAIFAPCSKAAGLTSKVKNVGELEYMRPPAPSTTTTSDLCPPLQSVRLVIVRLLFPSSFPTAHSGAVLSRTYALLSTYHKRLPPSTSPRFTLESIGLPPTSFKGPCPTPDPESVRLVVRHDPRRRSSFTLPDLLRAGAAAPPQDGSHLSAMESGSCPIIIYLPAYCRLTAIGLERLMKQADTTLCRYKPVGILPCELDGTDDVVPNLSTLLSLNPCGPRSRHGLFPSIAITTTALDPTTTTTTKDGCGGDIRDPADDLATALSTGTLPSTSYFHIDSHPVTLSGPDPLTASLPVFPAYATPPSFTYTMHIRTSTLLLPHPTTTTTSPTGGGVRRHSSNTTWELIHAVSEVALHLAFVVSFWLLCNTDIRLHMRHLTWAEAREKWGSCFGTVAHGVSPYRYYAAVVCALYTSAWLSAFLRVFSPGDGPVRYVVLLSCLFLLLPVAAITEAAVVVLCLAGVGRDVTALWYTGLGVGGPWKKKRGTTSNGTTATSSRGGGGGGGGHRHHPGKPKAVGVEEEEESLIADTQ